MKYFSFFFALIFSLSLFQPVSAALLTNQSFGINHIQDQGQKAQGIGFGIERLNAIWKNLQDNPYDDFDSYTVDYLHQRIDENKSFGIESFLLIEQPPQSMCLEICPTLSNIDYYEDFLQKLLEEFGDDIIGVEIFNEPDREVHWPPKPNPIHYVDILKKTKEVRDAFNPEILIIMGGHSGPPNEKAGYTFLYDIYDAGVKGYYDIFNYHHYTQNQSPDEGWGHPAYWYTIFDSFFAEHDPDMKIWVTEFGYATAGDDAHEVVGQKQQPEYLIKIIPLLLSLPRVEKIMLYELKDSPLNNLKYGLLNEDSTPKISERGMKKIIKELVGTDFKEQIIHDNLFIEHYLFESDQKRVHITWLQKGYVFPKPGKINSDSQALITFQPYFEKVNIYNAIGGDLTFIPRGDVMDYTLTHSPAIIVEEKNNFDENAIQYLLDTNIAGGFSDGLFHPERSITRAELLKITFNAFQIKIEENSEIVFPDIPEDHWVIPYATAAKKLGIVKGDSSGLLHPNRRVSEYEALKILMIASGLPLDSTTFLPYNDIGPENDFLQYIRGAYDQAILEDASYLYGDQFLFRGEMAEMVYGLR